MHKLTCNAVACGLALVLALTGCGAAASPSGTATTEAAPQQEPAPTELAANTYQMLSLNGQDTAEAAAEYLNSGYTEAAYQLVLFDDGGGLIYDGRSVGAVSYTPTTLTIDGKPAELAFNADRLEVTWGKNELVFDAHGTPSPARATSTEFAGTYQESGLKDGQSAELVLEPAGTGTYRLGEGERTPVFWGREQILGTTYLVLDGSLYTMTRSVTTKDNKTRVELTATNARTGKGRAFVHQEK